MHLLKGSRNSLYFEPVPCTVVVHTEATMPLSGKLEVTIKITSLPSEVTTTKNGWKEFQIELGSRSAIVALRPRLWTRMETAAQTFPHWIAVITGQMGDDVTKNCFRLVEPNVQVFEYTPKSAPAAQPGTTPTTPEQGKAE